MKRFCVLFAIIAVTSAIPTETDGLVSSALRFVKDCGDKSMVLCMKERALHYVDGAAGDIQIGDGILLVENEPNSPIKGRSLNDVDLPVEGEARETEIDMLLVDRVARFLGSHTLQFKVPKDSIEDMQRSLEEARGKKKKAKKILLPLLLLLKLKAAALLPIIIGFLALIAFKALIIGKLALVLSGILALKKLFDSKGSSSSSSSGQTYEVVSSPHQSSYDEHGHYRRSFDAQNIAYAGYNQ